MALKPHDTHQVVYNLSGILRQSFLPYLSSILQNRGLSDKMVKLVTNRYKYYWYGEGATLTRRGRMSRSTRLPMLN